MRVLRVHFRFRSPSWISGHVTSGSHVTSSGTGSHVTSGSHVTGNPRWRPEPEMDPQNPHEHQVNLHNYLRPNKKPEWKLLRGTRRNNNVIITSKQRRDVISTSKYYFLHRVYAWLQTPFSTLQWRHNDHNDCLKSPASRLFTQPFMQTQIKENIKGPRHWPYCGEFTTLNHLVSLDQRLWCLIRVILFGISRPKHNKRSISNAFWSQIQSLPSFLTALCRH